MYILITGGFDPLHSGHLDIFNHAASMGKVIVGLNSDDWLTRKKGAFLMPYEERVKIVSNLQSITDVLPEWDDSDDSSVDAIKVFNTIYSNIESNELLLFGNGGDRTPSTVNEKEYLACQKHGIAMLFCLGGPKVQSSSDFLAQYCDKKQLMY